MSGRNKKITWFIVGVLICAATAAWFFSGSRIRQTNKASNGQGSMTAATRVDAVAASSMPRVLLGKVQLPDGTPAANAAVLVIAEASSSILKRVTDGSGAFEFADVPIDRLVVTASLDGYTAGYATVDLRGSREATTQVVVQLEKCAARMKGHVRDASGGVVVGAMISQLVQGDRVRDVLSGQDGKFELCVRGGDTQIGVEATGYAAISFTIYVDSETERDVELSPEAVIEGVVLSASGPYPNAIVEARNNSPINLRPLVRRVRSADDGRFRLEGLTAGRWMLSATGLDQASRVAVEVVVQYGTNVKDVTLRVASCATLRGKVLDGTRPVSGLEISAVQRETLRSSQASVTQADGSFELQCVSTGPTAFRIPNVDVLNPAAITVKGDESDIVVTVASRGAIRGRVLFGGRAIAGAVVTYMGGNRPQMPVVSDAAGRFEIVGLPPSQYRLSAADGARASESVNVALALREQKTVDLELGAGGVIRGQVIDQDGAPVQAVRVVAAREDGDDQGAAITDSQGKFSVGTLAGGVYHATVSQLGAGEAPIAPLSAPFPKIVLTGPDAVADALLQVRFVRDVVSGTVLDASGSPVADALVSLAPVGVDNTARFASTAMPGAQTISGGDGQFIFRKVARGRYVIRATTPLGGEGQSDVVQTPAAGVSVTLRPVSDIEGTLEGFTSDVTIFAQSLAAANDDSYRASVDERKFSIHALPPGRYMITAQSLSEGATAMVDVIAGQTANVRLVSGGTGRISGQVVDAATKAPVAGERCSVRLVLDGWLGKTTYAGTLDVDATGRFTFDQAPAGAIAVECVGNGGFYSMGLTVVTVTRGAAVAVEIPLVHYDVMGDVGMRFDLRRTRPIAWIVNPAGSAAAAGVLPGDEVQSVDGKAVAGLSPHGVGCLIANRTRGSKVSTQLKRNGKDLALVIEVK